MATEAQVKAALAAFYPANGNRPWPRAALDLMEAAIDAAGSDVWQLIETAPKDGTQVLLWSEMWSMTYDVVIAHWVGERDGWVCESFITGEWDEEDQPTHWAPLPRRPKLDEWAPDDATKAGTP